MSVDHMDHLVCLNLSINLNIWIQKHLCMRGGVCNVGVATAHSQYPPLPQHATGPK